MVHKIVPKTRFQGQYWVPIIHSTKILSINLPSFLWHVCILGVKDCKKHGSSNMQVLFHAAQNMICYQP